MIVSGGVTAPASEAEHPDDPQRHAGLPPRADGRRADPSLSGDFSTTDMVNRLEPKTFRWLESSPAEQEFLGWTLDAAPREVVPGDRPPRRPPRGPGSSSGRRSSKGEAHGLIVRIRTAQGKPKAIEMNVGVRYGPDMTVATSAATSPTSPPRSGPSANCGSGPAS